MKKRTSVLGAIIVAAALTRLLPHPPNATPIAAMALFGGAYLANRRLACLIPVTAMLLSDLVLGWTRYGIMTMVLAQPVVYICLLVSVGIGRLIENRRSLWQVAAATLAGSCLFFFATNFAVWTDGSIYPLTLQGLGECYMAGIPFFRNTVLGDAVFSTILFGGFAWLENHVASLRNQAAPPVLAGQI